MEMLMLVICLLLPAKEINVFYDLEEIIPVKVLIEVVEEIPEEISASVGSITFYTKENVSTGYALRNNIMIFGLSKYDEFHQKYVIIHEMAHCWAFSVLNDNYEGYSEYVKRDNAVISKYSTTGIAEDFADAVAYYFLADGFKEAFPNRSEFIERCLEWKNDTQSE